MTRAGLVTALLIAAATGLVFGLYPGLDLRLARLFYDPEKHAFALAAVPSLAFLRDAAMWIVTALAAPAILALLIKILVPVRPMLVSARAALFLAATLALGPGVLANGLLKEHWGRPRPVQVTDFGGTLPFAPWWRPGGGCARNCSFVSGEGTGAFWTFAPAALAPPAWRAAAYGAAAAFGLGVGALRMAFGGHFLSDVLFAGVFMFLLVWTVHGLIYRWRTRLTDAQIERVLERAAMPGFRLLCRLVPAIGRLAPDEPRRERRPLCDADH